MKVREELPERIVWVSLAEEDLQSLLRVARAAKGAVYHMQMCGDESDAQRNLLEALKEVEHLLDN